MEQFAIAEISNVSRSLRVIGSHVFDREHTASLTFNRNYCSILREFEILALVHEFAAM